MITDAMVEAACRAFYEPQHDRDRAGEDDKIVARENMRAALEAAAGFFPTHRHYKGGLYQLDGYGRSSETEQENAYYRSADGRRWDRPRAMFDEPGRFVAIGEER